MASKSSLVIGFFAFLSAWIVGVILAKATGFHYALITLNLTLPLELVWMGLVVAVFSMLFFGRLGFLFFLALGFVQSATVSFSVLLLVLGQTIVLVWFGLLGVLIGELLFDDLRQKIEFNLLNKKAIAVFLIGIFLAIIVSSGSAALVNGSQNGIALAKDYRDGKFSFEKLFSFFQSPLPDSEYESKMADFLSLSQKSGQVGSLESFSLFQTRTVFFQGGSRETRARFLKFENSLRLEESAEADSNTWFDYNGTAVFCSQQVDESSCRKTDRESLELAKARALKSFETDWDQMTRQYFLEKSKTTQEHGWFEQLSFQSAFSVLSKGEREVAGRTCRQFEAAVNADKALQRLAEISKNPGIILDAGIRQNFPVVTNKMCLDIEHGVVLNADLTGNRTVNAQKVSRETIESQFRPVAARVDVEPPLSVKNAR